MSYKARTFGGTLTDMVGGGPAQTFGKVTVTGKVQLFAGDPPAEMLASDKVLVMDMAGAPWPCSVADRKGTKPRAQELARSDGKWPSKRELKLQAVAEAKLANPLEAGIAIEMARTPMLSREDAMKRVQSRLVSDVDIPDITLPKSKSD